MLQPDRDIARSLVPVNADVIQSDVVDIYPVSQVETFLTSPESAELPLMSDADQTRYLDALVGEREFLVNRLGKRVPELPEGATAESAHRFFTEHGIGKLGLRNIEISGSQITADHLIVPHPAYACFSEDKNQRLREFGSVLGAAVVLVTADDKLIIQHRNPKNRVYGDVPGASIAGLVDATPEVTEPIDLLPLIQRHILSEGQEEIGLSSSVTDSFELTSIQIDKIALHHELTFSSKTSLTSNEIILNAIQNSHRDDAASFRENIVVLDATPLVIERLLTENKSPFPMTHAGPILMLGHRLMQRSPDPLETAAQWLERVKHAMDQNYRAIDALSTDGRYTPAKSATEQGLPSFRQEVERLFSGDSSYYVECAWK
jgi:hypothetical protein